MYPKGGDLVSIEVLQSIKNAEIEAEEIIKKSAADARKIVSNAENQAHKLLDQLGEDLQSKHGSIILEAEKAAEVEIHKKRDAIAQECAEIKKKAGNKIDDAANIIVGRIVKINGNS